MKVTQREGMIQRRVFCHFKKIKRDPRLFQSKVNVLNFDLTLSLINSSFSNWHRKGKETTKSEKNAFFQF